jgi:hypothetical protein
MILNVRRAVYTFTLFLSSKNDKNTPLLFPDKWRAYRCNKKGATGKVQLLLLFNGAETRIRTRDTRIFSPMLYRLSYLGATQKWRGNYMEG